MHTHAKNLQGMPVICTICIYRTEYVKFSENVVIFCYSACSSVSRIFIRWFDHFFLPWPSYFIVAGMNFIVTILNVKNTDYTNINHYRTISNRFCDTLDFFNNFFNAFKHSCSSAKLAFVYFILTLLFLPIVVNTYVLQ